MCCPSFHRRLGLVPRCFYVAAGAREGTGEPDRTTSSSSTIRMLVFAFLRPSRTCFLLLSLTSGSIHARHQEENSISLNISKLHDYPGKHRIFCGHLKPGLPYIFQCVHIAANGHSCLSSTTSGNAGRHIFFMHQGRGHTSWLASRNPQRPSHPAESRCCTTRC